TLILMMMKTIITWRMTMLMRLYISCLAENIDVSFSDKQFASLANWTVFAMVVVKCTWEFSGSINIQEVLLFGNSLFVILTIMQSFVD
ncbi:hypothetical protein D5086_006295, partial [Populus alba]